MMSFDMSMDRYSISTVGKTPVLLKVLLTWNLLTPRNYKIPPAYNSNRTLAITMHRIASLRSFTQRRSVPPTGFYCDQHLHRYRPHNFLANTIKGDFKIGSHRQFRWTAVRLFSSTTIDGRLSSDDLNKVVLTKIVLSCYTENHGAHTPF